MKKKRRGRPMKEQIFEKIVRISRRLFKVIEDNNEDNEVFGETLERMFFTNYGTTDNVEGITGTINKKDT